MREFISHTYTYIQFSSFRFHGSHSPPPWATTRSFLRFLFLSFYPGIIFGRGDFFVPYSTDFHRSILDIAPLLKYNSSPPGKNEVKTKSWIHRIYPPIFKMVVMSLVPETKMADVGKLVSLGNLLVRKVTWFVLTTTSESLIFSSAFGADCMTRIAYIYSRLPRTHSLHFD